MVSTESSDFPDNTPYRFIASQKRNYVLRLHEADILLHTAPQARKIEGGVCLLYRPARNPNVITIQAYCKRRRVVGPQIKCAAAAQVESCMVPVTREDAVLDSPFAQGESHVGAAIVEREYSVLIRAKQPARDLHREPSSRAFLANRLATQRGKIHLNQAERIRES